MENSITFSQYIIEQRSKNFYLISLGDIVKFDSTLEEWFYNMYFDYKIIYGKFNES